MHNDTYLIESLFSRESYYRILSVQLLFGQPFHAYSHALLGAQGYYTETFGLTIGTILEELYFHKIRHSDALNSICYILVTCPLEIKFVIG